jgi:hypothetical protein
MASNLYTKGFLAPMGRNPVYLRVSGIFGPTSLIYSQRFSASLGARKCLSPVNSFECFWDREHPATHPPIN